jgi:hypothetical protein
MAEGEGFEPPLPFRVKRFSRPPVSTAHTSLRVRRIPMIRRRVKSLRENAKQREVHISKTELDSENSTSGRPHLESTPSGCPSRS